MSSSWNGLAEGLRKLNHRQMLELLPFPCTILLVKDYGNLVLFEGYVQGLLAWRVEFLQVCIFNNICSWLFENFQNYKKKKSKIIFLSSKFSS